MKVVCEFLTDGSVLSWYIYRNTHTTMTSMWEENNEQIKNSIHESIYLSLIFFFISLSHTQSNKMLKQIVDIVESKHHNVTTLILTKHVEFSKKGTTMFENMVIITHLPANISPTLFLTFLGKRQFWENSCQIKSMVTPWKRHTHIKQINGKKRSIRARRLFRPLERL